MGPLLKKNIMFQVGFDLYTIIKEGTHLGLVPLVAEVELDVGVRGPVLVHGQKVLAFHQDDGDHGVPHLRLLPLDGGAGRRRVEAESEQGALVKELTHPTTHRFI